MKIRKDYETMKFLIDPNKLDLSQFQKEKEKLLSLPTAIDQLQYISEYLVKEIPLIDIFSNNQFTETKEPNNIIQFYLIYLLCLLEKKLMSQLFQGKKIYLDLKEDDLISMPKKLFQTLFSLLFSSKIFEVQFTIIEILSTYSYYCEDFAAYSLENDNYISKIFQFTYSNNIDLVNNIIVILDNILSDNLCDLDCLDKIFQRISIIQCCKDILSNELLKCESKIPTMELIYHLSIKMDINKFEDYFDDFMPIFSKLLEKIKGNDKILELILNIISKITNDFEICKKIINTGLDDCLLKIFFIPKITEKCLLLLLMTFSNLFYYDEIIIYFLQKCTDNNILGIISVIFQTFINSNTIKDNHILIEALVCISNVASGPEIAKNLLFKNGIINLIIQIMKVKNENNNIYFEGLRVFYNMIYDCSKDCFCNLSEFSLLKLFGEGLEKTNNADNIILCLKSIILIYEKNNKIYNTVENLKIDYISLNLKKRINELIDHKNKNIEEYANTVLNLFEDKMNAE